MIVKMHQAKTQLSKLIAAAMAGEDVVIARGSEPMVRLTPIVPPAKKKRVPGRLKGLVEWDERFLEPLPEADLALWEGAGDEA
jgi:prevent-host-death family protein